MDADGNLHTPRHSPQPNPQLHKCSDSVLLSCAEKKHIVVDENQFPQELCIALAQMAGS